MSIYYSISFLLKSFIDLGWIRLGRKVFQIEDFLSKNRQALNFILNKVDHNYLFHFIQFFLLFLFIFRKATSWHVYASQLS